MYLRSLLDAEAKFSNGHTEIFHLQPQNYYALLNAARHPSKPITPHLKDGEYKTQLASVDQDGLLELPDLHEASAEASDDAEHVQAAVVRKRRKRRRTCKKIIDADAPAVGMNSLLSNMGALGDAISPDPETQPATVLAITDTPAKAATAVDITDTHASAKHAKPKQGLMPNKWKLPSLPLLTYCIPVYI